MSDDVAIRVEGLSKRYKIGTRGTHADELRGRLASAVTAPFRRLFSRNGKKRRVGNEEQSTKHEAQDTKHQAPSTKHEALGNDQAQSTKNHEPSTTNQAPDPPDHIWALKDISFEARRGEILGIIGRNGAGKSTLLKILSRITEPTEGRVEIIGRLAALLEVGTGFHPELTGRENVYLNGSILGMTKREIDRQFDAIVDFAGVEKFIDTPVKRYSSGMHVRLGFAVAAHLEPEMLVVDEVLAVGDAEFQKRCLKKMENVAEHGRTVLIVSHNMASITALCPRAILLEQGSLTADGRASQVVMAYLGKRADNPCLVDFSQRGPPPGDDLATLRRAWIEDEEGRLIDEVDIRQPFRIKMEYELHTLTPKPPSPNIHVLDQRGEYVFVTGSNNHAARHGHPGIYVAECSIPGNFLNDGGYFLDLAVTFTHEGSHASFWEKGALSITVRDPVLETVDTLRCGYVGPIPGPVRPQLDWRIDRIS